MERRNFIKLLGLSIVASPTFSQLDLHQNKHAVYNYTKRLIKTGIPDLDKKIIGFNPGELVLVGGRPVIGKTQFALQIVQESIFKNNLTVGYFSVECSKDSLMRRLIASDTNIPINRIIRGELRKEDWHSFINTAHRISGSNLYVDDTCSLTPQKIQYELNILAKTKNADVIIVDYLQLMDTEKKYKTRKEMINSILADLKQIAVENNVAVVVLSQLNRIERKDKRPNIHDLAPLNSKDANVFLNLEQVDKVILLHRESYYEIASTNNKAEYHIVKNVNGKIGVATDATVQLTQALSR